MGSLTIRISDDLELALRKKAAQLYGARKGSLSKAVEEAIRVWLATSEDTKDDRRIYRAFRGDKLIAEARTLDELAEKLKKSGESIRGLRILREPAPKRERRLGLRVRGVS